MGLFVFLVFMLTAAWVQARPLIARRQWRELLAYGVLWVAAVAYGGLVLAEVKLPHAGEVIIRVFGGISRALLRQ